MSEKDTELYKKYRPSKWSEIIGQNKVVKSLQAAIETNKIPSAYIFAGTHGSGKTSAALILAKALNCENIQPKNNPCNSCETCKAIDEGRQVGVNYISMANYGGADSVRDIVSKARLNQPVKKQVWILDEVHNLSKQAFDALLIPLEQENNFLFIFCTTEINKVPKTVLSRIQQRKFNSIDSDLMKRYMKHITDKEGLEIEDNLLEEAVRQGRGSVRDTFTALETIKETGVATKDLGTQLLEAFSNRDYKQSFLITSKLSTDGVDFRLFAEQMFEDMRDLTLIVNDCDTTMVNFSHENPKALFKKFKSYSIFFEIMENLGETITKMSIGADPRILFETFLVKNMNYLNKRSRENNN